MLYLYQKIKKGSGKAGSVEAMTELNIKVSLEEDDKRRFIEKCLIDGVTPEEVIQDFINNLVSSNRSLGSDERDLAEEYYDRCCYGYIFEDEYKSFAIWAKQNFVFDEILELIEEIDDFEKEIEYLNEHPEEDETGKERIEYVKILGQANKELKKYFREYTEDIKNADNFENAINNILEFNCMLREKYEI